MTYLFDTTDLLSLIWPLMLCAAAWGIVVWALRQRDQVSEALNGLLSPHRSTEFASRSDSHMAKPSADIGQGPLQIGGNHDLESRRMHSGPR